MYFQEEEPLPTLIPINKKKITTVSYSNEPQKHSPQPKTQKLNVLQPKNPKKDSKVEQKRSSQKQQKQIEQMNPAKVEEFDTRFKSMNENSMKKENQQKMKNTDKWKQTQKAKALIDEMLHKINAKNVTEELYPVTNETIQALIKQAEAEILKLTTELERKQSSLTLNPNNLNLKSQVQALKSSIDRAVTIKELYFQKINQRNKIMTLEKTIIGLKEQNANLKIKINRGIETIQKHMHNLPCEKQKQLLQELESMKNKYSKEKDMREQLETNLSQIVMNFKRLYDEADTARLIITKKLKQISQKQKNIQPSFPPFHYPSSGKNTPKNSAPADHSNTEDKGKPSTKVGEVKNFSPNLTANKTPPKIINISQNDRITPTRPTKPSQPAERVLSGMFSLEEQIKKMRNNQNTMRKR